MPDNKKILIIDSDPDIRMTLEYSLGKLGYEVFTVKEGQEGLKKCLAERPQVVLSEALTPNLNGYELCGKIKGEPVTRHITHFILMTARPESEVLLRGAESCADFFIPKPFNPRDLEIDLEILFEIDFHPSPETLSRFRVIKRVPTHKESITPGYSHTPGRVIRLIPPSVKIGERDRIGGASERMAGHASGPQRRAPRDPRLEQVNELLCSLAGSFRQTQQCLDALVRYLDQKAREGLTTHSKN